jgi:hypothetical protein
MQNQKHFDASHGETVNSIYTPSNPPPPYNHSSMASPGDQPTKVRRILTINGPERDERPPVETTATNTSTASAASDAPPPSDEMGSTTTGGPSTGTTNDASTLTRCHLCSKAPRMRQDLGGYSDCWRCLRRTCSVCMRACIVNRLPGMGFIKAVMGYAAVCRGQPVCRACSVELRPDGRVYCLPCFDDFEMDKEDVVDNMADKFFPGLGDVVGELGRSHPYRYRKEDTDDDMDDNTDDDLDDSEMSGC